MAATSEIYQLGYFSSLQGQPAPADLADLFDSSRARNQRRAITSLVLIDRHNVFQMLEGSRDSVLRLFDRVQSDERHIGVTVTVSRSVPRREFGRSPLSTYDFGAITSLPLTGIDAFLRQRFDLGSLSPAAAVELCHLCHGDAQWQNPELRQAWTPSPLCEIPLYVRCQACAAPSCVHIPALVLGTALTRWSSIRLHCDVHNCSWDASAAEMASIRDCVRRLWHRLSAWQEDCECAAAE